MNKAEKMQSIFKAYSKAHNHAVAPAKDVAKWAVDNGLLTLPRIDPIDLLAEQMARSLREERRMDAEGRYYRVNHAAHVMKDGVQYTFWGEMEFAPSGHIDMSFTQRREQIIGDCHQLKVDVDAFNGIRKNGSQYELILDFTDDVAERQLSSKLGIRKRLLICPIYVSEFSWVLVLLLAADSAFTSTVVSACRA